MQIQIPSAMELQRGHGLKAVESSDPLMVKGGDVVGASTGPRLEGRGEPFVEKIGPYVILALLQRGHGLKAVESGP